MQNTGTPSAAPVTNILHTCRTCAVRSVSGPTMKPGVSHRLITGKPCASHNCRKRAALSAAGASIAPPRCAGLFAIRPNAAPSIRSSAVIMPGAKPLRSSMMLPSSART